MALAFSHRQYPDFTGTVGVGRNRTRVLRITCDSLGLDAEPITRESRFGVRDPGGQSRHGRVDP